MGIETLPEFIRKVTSEAMPMGQNTEADNLGFGWIYYGLIRNLRPSYVIAIGSAKGFTPFCAARAVQDNGAGQVIFVDPGYEGAAGWGGDGVWRDAGRVEEWIAHFNLTVWLTHFQMAQAEAFPRVSELAHQADVGVVIIDGAHTYEQSLKGFELCSSLMKEGYALFHDSVWSGCGAPRMIR